MSSLLYICLLFVVFISHHGATTEAAVEAVKDINGQSLRSGYKYYIMPVVRGRGGGLTISEPENKTCPRSVIQDQLEVSQGLPIQFSPAEKSSTIRVSTDLKFRFSATSIWKLDNFDEKTNHYFVSTCGFKGIPVSKRLVTGSRLTNLRMITRSGFVLPSAISAKSCVEILEWLYKWTKKTCFK